MNIHLCRVALRPRDPFEVFDLTFRVAREIWAPFGKAVFVLLAPAWLIGVFLLWLTDGHPAVMLWPLLLSPLLQAPFTVLGGRLMFAPGIRLRDVLYDVSQQTPTLLATWFVAALSWVFAGAFTCGVAIPFAQGVLLFLPETALLERVDTMRCVRRSQRLAGGHLGTALVGAFSWWILTLWFAILGEAAWQAIFDTVLQLGQPFGSVTDGVATPGLLFGALFAQPVHALYRLLLYLDVRTRMEGWDLQVSLRAAGMPK